MYDFHGRSKEKSNLHIKMKQFIHKGCSDFDINVIYISSPIFQNHADPEKRVYSFVGLDKTAFRYVIYNWTKDKYLLR